MESQYIKVDENIYIPSRIFNGITLEARKILLEKGFDALFLWAKERCGKCPYWNPKISRCIHPEWNRDRIRRCPFDIEKE